jgi:protein TonB
VIAAAFLTLALASFAAALPLDVPSLSTFPVAFLEDPPIVKMSEQEVRKAATTKVDPEYPAVARQIRVTGEVVLEVTISTAGNVETVKVVRGNTLLTNAAISAVKRWKFTPLVAAGKPAAIQTNISFSFKQ